MTNINGHFLFRQNHLCLVMNSDVDNYKWSLFVSTETSSSFIYEFWWFLHMSLLTAIVFRTTSRILFWKKPIMISVMHSWSSQKSFQIAHCDFDIRVWFSELFGRQRTQRGNHGFRQQYFGVAPDHRLSGCHSSIWSIHQV